MSELSDSNQTVEPTPPVLSHRRILMTMAAVAIFGSLAGFAFISWQFSLGILFGGILSLINYYWLKVSLKKLFDAAVAHGEKPRFLAVRYFARYLTLGAILTVVFLTQIVPVVAVIAGLASFALAIVIEGFIRLFSSLFNSREL
ncbi:MAG: ATP synthase subunit I [Pyrinomonadaceae bacterium]|nr:ATP synthase subunit I [Pyrinomonadaceae bacterium]